MTKTFYLCKFSARLVLVGEDLCLEPKSNLVGLAHTFLPFGEEGEKGFATEISHRSNDFVKVEIEGLDFEQRKSLRAKLDAKAKAVLGAAEEMEEECDVDEEEEDWLSIEEEIEDDNE